MLFRSFLPVSFLFAYLANESFGVNGSLRLNLKLILLSAPLLMGLKCCLASPGEFLKRMNDFSFKLSVFLKFSALSRHNFWKSAVANLSH